MQDAKCRKFKHPENKEESKLEKRTLRGKLELVKDSTIVASWGCSLCDCPSFEYTDDAQFCDFCEHTRSVHNQ